MRLIGPVHVIYLIDCVLCKKQYTGNSKTSFNIKVKNDWIPIKYLKVLHHNRTQKHLQHFFLNVLQKYDYLFWVLWTSLATSIKCDNGNLKKLRLFACKKINFTSNSFFEIF